MMTPALDSAYGNYTLYSTDPPVETNRSGGQYILVCERNGVIETYLEGPPNSFMRGDPKQRAVLKIPLDVYIDTESQAAAIESPATKP